MAATETDPLTESRMLAILHLAIHDTLNTIEPRYRTFGTVRTTTPRRVNGRGRCLGRAHDPDRVAAKSRDHLRP